MVEFSEYQRYTATPGDATTGYAAIGRVLREPFQPNVTLKSLLVVCSTTPWKNVRFMVYREPNEPSWIGIGSGVVVPMAPLQCRDLPKFFQKIYQIIIVVYDVEANDLIDIWRCWDQ